VKFSASSPESRALTISLPLSSYANAHVACLSELHSRLAKLNQLPKGWMDATVKEAEMVLCHIIHPSASTPPAIDFTITVNAMFFWTLHFYTEQVQVDY